MGSKVRDECIQHHQVMVWILCCMMLILTGVTKATPASVPPPDSPPPPPPPPQVIDIWAPPPPREYIPPDDYPRNGMRWCRDRNYSCYGMVMQCYSQFCPLDQCVMDCAACELRCVSPSPNTTHTPPPPPPPASPSPPDPYQNDDFWTPARPVFPDDFPVMGTRWCRDIRADCYGDHMICNSEYCPLDQCYMECGTCSLGCRVPLLTPPWDSPPSQTPPPPISTSTPSPSPASPPSTTPPPISAPPLAPLPPPASPPSKPPPHHSHEKRTRSKNVTCKNKKFPRCYGKSFVCPRSCPRTCKVNCVSCKPVCPKL